jgi:two-component system OmpR family sensor kinase
VKRLPIRARLTLAFAVAMSVLLAAVGAFLYVQLGRSLSRSLDQSLRGRAAIMAALVSQSDSGLREAPPSSQTEVSIAQVVDARGKVVDTTRGASFAPLLTLAQARRALRSPFFVDRGAEERLFAMPVHAQNRVVVVVAGASREPRAAALSSLRTDLLIGGPIALLLASALGFALASGALGPIEAMRARASDISASERGARLPVPAARDEVARLAETVNALLGRLEEALERERRFVADASHELRTPLALLKAEIELALEGPDAPALLRGALDSAGEEVDRLTRLAADLLQLARLDDGLLPVRLEDVDVQRLVEGVVARFGTRASADGRSVAVVSGPELAIEADPLRVEQALVNLLDNALRHGDGHVEVRAAATGRGAVEVSVRDHGPGLPLDYLRRAANPFSRNHATRGRRGSGLGLAIVAAVAASHDGSVQIENAGGGGAVATLILPLRQRSKAAHVA